MNDNKPTLLDQCSSCGSYCDSSNAHYQAHVVCYECMHQEKMRVKYNEAYDYQGEED